MSESLQFQTDDRHERHPDLPYRLELWDGRQAVSTVLALSSSPGVAYAAYYAALREYLGQSIKLSLDGRVLISSSRG